MKRKKKDVNGALVIPLILITLFFWRCKDEDAGRNDHNPSAPVKITSFTPESGGARTQLFIHGENFGTDVSIITVTIGGIDAKVIGSNGDYIYCMVPPLAFEGTIEVTIGGEGVEPKIAVAEGKFDYQRNSLVGTLVGYVSETGEYKVEDGPFETAGFDNPNWLSADPKNPNHIYVAEERYGLRLIDLENEEVSTVITLGQMNLNRIRSMDWTPDGDGLVIANDQGSEDGISTVLLRREDAFLRAETMTWSKSCNGVGVHPVNGEYYFSQYEGGSIHRFDPEVDVKHQELFKVWATGYEITPIFHPTGNYAYLVIMNQHCIVKSIYDWDKKRLNVPQPFVGEYSQSGWRDGVGTSARFNTIWQGVFVKNEEYVKQGLADVYDFYLCDRNTGSIRKVTPEGMVVTFAGRGSPGLDGNHWGYVDGDLRKEARFDQPAGIAWDESRSTFYIGDNVNRRIRTITVEGEVETTNGTGEGDND